MKGIQQRLELTANLMKPFYGLGLAGYAGMVVFQLLLGCLQAKTFFLDQMRKVDAGSPIISATSEIL